MFLDSEKSDLEKIADFLFLKAEKARKAGAFDILSHENMLKMQSEHNKKKLARVLAIGSNDVDEHLIKSNTRCLHCGRNNHTIASCKDLTREPIRERWRVIRSQRLCYNCLGSDHIRLECKKSNGCNQCARRHHQLLHFKPKNEKISENKLREESNVPISLSANMNSVDKQNLKNSQKS